MRALKPMKTLLIILVVLLAVAVVATVILNHPCFGRRMGKERKARIVASPHYRDGQFQNQIPTPQFTGNTNMMSAMREMRTLRNTCLTNIKILSAPKQEAIF